MAIKYSLFIKSRSGKTAKLSGARAAKLRKALAEGRGNAEITSLICNDYVGYLGPDGDVWDFEALAIEHFDTY